MSFLYPALLYGLALIAIPIIIHLFYFRRFKRVYFTNVRFLQEVKEETSMRSRLRNLLVLLLRCLAVAAIVIAFAQPFIPSPEGTRAGVRAVSVYVDNSFSMEAEGERAPLLQLATDAAREIVAAYGPEDRFQVLTNAFRGRSQRMLSQEEALLELDEVAIGPQSRRLSDVLSRQQSALAVAPADSRVAYLISDFQANVTDLPGRIDSSLSVYLLPVQAPRDRNVGIDSVWLEAPVALVDQNNLLLVRVRNYGSAPVSDVRISSTYGGQTNPEGTLRIAAGSSVVDSINLRIDRGGPGSAVIGLTDFPVQFDDTYPIAFRTTDRVAVLVIGPEVETTGSLEDVLELDVFSAAFVSSRQVNYGDFADRQLLILTGVPEISSGLAEQLVRYVDGGGNLLLFPPADAQLPSYNRLLRGLGADELAPFERTEREVTEVNEEEFVFRDVLEEQRRERELPVSRGNFPLSSFADRGQEVLLRYRDGSAALAKYPYGQGQLYLMTSPFDAELSSLPGSPELLIPMLYKMGLSSNSRRPLAYTIGRDEVITVAGRPPGQDQVYRLVGPAGEFIPPQQRQGDRTVLGLGEQLPEAGIYRLTSGSETIERLAFIYDRRESELSTTPPADLARFTTAEVLDVADLDRLGQTIRQRNEGRPQWTYFLWAALICLFLEALVLRVWKA
jgi:hypothetical protein